MQNDITIATCNFNTTRLTNQLIDSIIQFVDFDYNIVVLDNSDKFRFSTTNNQVKIIDNTNQHILNFNEFIEEFGGISINNYANMKHAISIQFLLNICQTEYMLLFDSDAQLKNKVDFIEQEYVTIGGLQKQYIATWSNNEVRLPRIVPFIQFFNIPLLRQFKLKYFDPLKIIGSYSDNASSFDTGASFYEEIVKNDLPIKIIDYTKYINHILGASWAKAKAFEN